MLDGMLRFLAPWSPGMEREMEYPHCRPLQLEGGVDIPADGIPKEGAVNGFLTIETYQDSSGNWQPTEKLWVKR